MIHPFSALHYIVEFFYYALIGNFNSGSDQKELKPFSPENPQEIVESLSEKLGKMDASDSNDAVLEKTAV